MIRITRKSRQAGFTLLELVIVLSITGLIVAGLWRLVASSNQQLRDQSTAAQQQQLVNSVKAFLSSPTGLAFLATNNASTTPYALNLPTVNNGACTIVPASNSAFCSYLSLGFITTSTNPYGQTFSIRVIGDGAGAGVTPNSYSFMILTAGGQTIPDTSGGRIAAGIGGDGGFVYANNVCNTQTGVATNRSVCGAFGAWSADLRQYFTGSTAVGQVASRTYITPEQDSALPWLARSYINGTVAYNTMATDLFMTTNGNGLHAGRSYIYMAPNSATITGGGKIEMAQGTIDMQGVGGSLNMNGSPIVMAGGAITLGGGTLNGINGAMPANSPIAVSTGCTIYTAPGCTIPAISVPTGDISVATGEVNAKYLYATTFIYQTSDARLKTDIHPVQNPLDDVMKLKPVTFAFKADGQKSLGVIAQDLEKVYPQLVSQNGGTKYVNYDGLISPLIGAVQQLKHDNDGLRAEIERQTAREEKLQREIDALKSKPAP